MKIEHNKDFCPCDSGKFYRECCLVLHDGGYPENALALMRSRYSAYAKGLPQYIIKTTHPQNPLFNPDQKEWEKTIAEFCKNTQFVRLKILNFTDGQQQASVTFIAYLKQNGSEYERFEHSLFEKVGPQWLYLNGSHDRLPTPSWFL